MKKCAALLENFEIELSPENHPTFRALSTNEAHHKKLVIEQLRASVDEDCFSIVWPELAMPTALRQHLVEFIRVNVVEDNLPLPDIIVSGSWHEVDEGKLRNVSRVYDRFGAEKLAHRKIVPYFDSTHGTEDIAQATRSMSLSLTIFWLPWRFARTFVDIRALPSHIWNLASIWSLFRQWRCRHSECSQNNGGLLRVEKRRQSVCCPTGSPAGE